MGPRPDGRGRCGAGTSNDVRRTLQWGRGRMAAEGRGAGHCGHFHVHLQWGRGRMAAEGDAPPDDRVLTVAFNGAAAGWPRKAPVVVVPRQDSYLQWGRGRMAAEGMSKRPPLKARVVPSMGPRPDGRGRRPGPHGGSPGTLAFNGAAAGWPRKAGRHRVRPRRHGPSMGPRPDGRGRRRRRGRREAAPHLQWGRGRMAAEGCNSRTRRRATAAFNGAAAGWPRKAAASCSSTASAPTFNGAAAGWPRKGRPPAMPARAEALQWGRGRMAAEGVARARAPASV